MCSIYDKHGGPALLATCCLLLLIFGSPAARAVDWDGDLQIHGFATQGFVDTTSNRFFGDSEDGAFKFTELGINASYKASPSVLVSGQLLSRNAGDMDDGSPAIDYALIDWNLSNTSDGAFGLLAGRIKNTLGLYNDTRDVAFTRPSIFLPQQVYFDTVRDLFLSADGVHLYGRFNTDSGRWMVDFGAGTNPVDENVEIAFLSRNFAGDLDSDGVSLIARGEYETHDSRWRLGLSAAEATLEFDAAATDPIGSGKIDFLYWIASIQYNAERWSLTGEYMNEPVDYRSFGPLFDNRDSTVEGYYLQGSYLLRDDLQLIMRYAEGFSDKHDRDGRNQSDAIGGLSPPHSFFQKDWMIGMRWDVTPSFMLRAEYQWNHGTWMLSNRENPDPSATVEDWEMFSLLASCRF